MNHTWSAERDAKLTQLVEDKLAQNEIAEIMEVPKYKIKKRIYLLGISNGCGETGGSNSGPITSAAIRAASLRFAQDGQELLSVRKAA